MPNHVKMSIKHDLGELFDSNREFTVILSIIAAL
jgi:hypothetical protein